MFAGTNLRHIKRDGNLRFGMSPFCYCASCEGARAAKLLAEEEDRKEAEQLAMEERKKAEEDAMRELALEKERCVQLQDKLKEELEQAKAEQAKVQQEEREERRRAEQRSAAMFAKMEERLAAMTESMEAAKKEAAEQKLLADAIRQAQLEKENGSKESQKQPLSNREKRRAARRANSPGGPSGSDSSSGSEDSEAGEGEPGAPRGRAASSPIDPEKDFRERAVCRHVDRVFEPHVPLCVQQRVHQMVQRLQNTDPEQRASRAREMLEVARGAWQNLLSEFTLTTVAGCVFDRHCDTTVLEIMRDAVPFEPADARECCSRCGRLPSEETHPQVVVRRMVVRELNCRTGYVYRGVERTLCSYCNHHDFWSDDPEAPPEIRERRKHRAAALDKAWRDRGYLKGLEQSAAGLSKFGLPEGAASLSQEEANYLRTTAQLVQSVEIAAKSSVTELKVGDGSTFREKLQPLLTLHGELDRLMASQAVRAAMQCRVMTEAGVLKVVYTQRIPANSAMGIFLKGYELTWEDSFPNRLELIAKLVNETVSTQEQLGIGRKLLGSRQTWGKVYRPVREYLMELRRGQELANLLARWSHTTHVSDNAVLVALVDGVDTRLSGELAHPLAVLLKEYTSGPTVVAVPEERSREFANRFREQAEKVEQRDAELRKLCEASRRSSPLHRLNALDDVDGSEEGTPAGEGAEADEGLNALNRDRRNRPAPPRPPAEGAPPVFGSREWVRSLRYYGNKDGRCWNCNGPHRLNKCPALQAQKEQTMAALRMEADSYEREMGKIEATLASLEEEGHVEEEADFQAGAPNQGRESPQEEGH
jgi:hypothetical protein